MSYDVDKLQLESEQEKQYIDLIDNEISLLDIFYNTWCEEDNIKAREMKIIANRPKENLLNYSFDDFEYRLDMSDKELVGKIKSFARKLSIDTIEMTKCQNYLVKKYFYNAYKLGYIEDYQCLYSAIQRFANNVNAVYDVIKADVDFEKYDDYIDYNYIDNCKWIFVARDFDEAQLDKSYISKFYCGISIAIFDLFNAIFCSIKASIISYAAQRIANYEDDSEVCEKLEHYECYPITIDCAKMFMKKFGYEYDDLVAMALNCDFDVSYNFSLDSDKNMAQCVMNLDKIYYWELQISRIQGDINKSPISVKQETIEMLTKVHKANEIFDKYFLGLKSEN